MISVEQEDGAWYCVGPYDSAAAAEPEADRIKATLRLARWKAEGRHGHPDDPPIFAWVVPLEPPGSPITNPFDDQPLEIVDSTIDYEAASAASTIGGVE